MGALAALRADPRLKWVGFALIAIALVALPFALAAAGTAWVRITNLAILFVLLSLGLNIVVGFAGLLDLGYIAFYAVGAYVYALLASPHFGLHLPWWAILPVCAAVACFFGVILGAPTLKLRGDYLAIVTLGFGEIIRIFLNNLSEPFNLTNGPKGIATIDPVRFFGMDFGTVTSIGDIALSGTIKYYYFLLAVLLSFVPEILRYTVEPVQRMLFGRSLIDPEVIRMLLFGLAMVLMMLFRPAGLLPSPVRNRELRTGRDDDDDD